MSPSIGVAWTRFLRAVVQISIQSDHPMWVLPRLLPRRPASSPYFHPSGSCRSVNPKPTGSDFCGVIYRAFSSKQRDSVFRLPPHHPATMNIFRLTGDLSHLAAIIILLLKIWKSRSCAGELVLFNIFHATYPDHI